MRISRREFVVAATALIAAGGLLGSTSLTLADPTPEELMRPGPLPDIAVGKADAPVTIVEYASMTCPHCAHFSQTTVPALKTKYIESGKVRLVFREFPLDEVALAASMIVRCAATDAQGQVNGDKAMALSEVLFNSQQKWATRNPIPALQQIAKQAGVTQKRFEECLADSKLHDAIVATRESATKEYKIESTPTLFVNGKM